MPNGPMLPEQSDEPGAGNEKEPLQLSAATRRYQQARRNDFSPETRRNVNHVLIGFSRSCGDIQLRSLRRHHVEGWMGAMHLAPSTIRSHLSIVRTFTAWAVNSELLRADPCAGLKGPRQPVAMPRELSLEEIQKLLASVPDVRGELIIMLGLVQGMRRSEIAGQLRENIDLSGRMMLVRGKGNKERWLPICDDTYETIVAYYRESTYQNGPLLRSELDPRRGLSPGMISKLVARWMRDAGVKSHAYDGRSAHALRHTRAGSMLDDGADVREVQAALGHSNLSATYIYLRRRHADSALREAMSGRRYR